MHSPEYEHEKNITSVREKVREFDLEHPIMIDNDFSYWRAIENRYWPTYYLIDQRGLIHAVFVGETHTGDARARKVEAAIRALLTTKAGSSAGETQRKPGYRTSSANR